MTARSQFRLFLRSLGPTIASGSLREAARAGLGALIGLGVAGLSLLSPQADLALGLYMIAPFGATSVLVFAVPNSPLAQPWSAVVGNGAAAAVAVAVCLAVPDPVLRIALAVGLSISAMVLLRAVHPPAGAVALTAALSPDAVQALGFRFVLAPVVAGTCLIVAIAMVYARATGRRYPFRQFDEPNAHGTQDPPPAERLGLSEAELTDILQRYRQSPNLGVEDLARLIGAAELQAAGHRVAPMTAAGIMSRDLVTVGPEAGWHEVATLFRRHGFTSLPVVGPGDRFLGLILQIDLIRRADEEAARGLAAAMRRLAAGGRAVRAREIMAADGARAAPETPVAALLPMLADQGSAAVPVLDGARIVGIVTQTDLIAALARRILERAPGA